MGHIALGHKTGGTGAGTGAGTGKDWEGLGGTGGGTGWTGDLHWWLDWLNWRFRLVVGSVMGQVGLVVGLVKVLV